MQSSVERRPRWTESAAALRSRQQRRRWLNRSHLAVTCSEKVRRVKRSEWRVCGRDGLEDGGTVVVLSTEKLATALEMETAADHEIRPRLVLRGQGGRCTS